ncbi:MAG: hypothetical protein EOP33_06575 [Rickettsiaceae bacterium]|nr:MAG: hypothetical protein EOP33_06575 [Rickettsiaceae bacterium]
MKSIIKIKKNLISYSGSVTNLFPKKVTPILHRNYNSLNHLDNYYTTGLVTQNAQMIATVIKDVSLGDHYL